MDHQDLIDIFADTQEVIRSNPSLRQQMIKSQAGSQLYLDGYRSAIRRKKGNGKVMVDKNTTFRCARSLSTGSSKVAVLNFANPHEPGGGVYRGAMAQEECLCRSSDLYNVLAQPYFGKHYYEYHYRDCDFMFSDRLIYSPDVTVFKSDDTYPQLLEEPFFVDVITCAAPYMNGSIIKTNEELLDIYRSRIRNILEVAMAKDVDCLVLGAFGNDPDLMARAFADLLIREHYAECFEKVVFAIKGNSGFNRNLASFEEAFYGISPEGNKRRFWM